MFGRKAILGAVVALSMAASGCTAGLAFATRPVAGTVGIYAQTQANEKVTQNPVGSKTGESCASSILGIVTTGDASVGAAAANGGITRIGVVDNKYTNLLGLFATYCVVVRGD